jgi:glycosyltransferase 2 family protein
MDRGEAVPRTFTPGLGRREGVIAIESNPRRNWHLGIWVTVALLAAGIWFLTRRFAGEKFDVATLLHTITRADWRWLAAAWVLNLLSYYGRVLRWMVMLRPLAPNADPWRLYSATVIGFSAMVLFGRPGEFVRPYLIARAAQVPVMSQMAAWLLERLYDTLTLLAIFGYSLAAVPHSALISGSALRWAFEVGGWFTGITCTLCLAVLAGLQRSSDQLGDRIQTALGFLEARHQERAVRLVNAAMDGLRSVRSTRSILEMFAHSILTWFLLILCHAALFQAFPETASLSWSAILVYIGFVAFGSIVQIPGIGGGVQLVSILVLTQLFHTGLETATGIALVTWVITLIGTVPVGAVLALHEGLNWNRIKELEKQATL